MLKRFGRLFSFLLAATLLLSACKSSADAPKTQPSVPEATGAPTASVTQPRETVPPETDPPATKPPTQSLPDYAAQVLTIVNQERAAQGRAPLAMDEQVCAAALVRAKELETLFSHTRPDGTSCFTVFEELGISYRMVGENIAAGQRTPEEVMTAWMNSEGHRDNILNEDFTHIGIACVYIPNSPYGYYWVQLFLSKLDTPATNPPVTGQTPQSLPDYAAQVLTIVNQERAAQGRAPLAMDEQVCAAALVRAKELETLFSHTRPDGTSCFTVFEELGISYRMVGENIAAGQRTPEEVMTAWMNSEGHRANILNEDFTHIGIACVYIPNSPYGYYWVQLFLCKWGTS